MKVFFKKISIVILFSLIVVNCGSMSRNNPLDPGSRNYDVNEVERMIVEFRQQGIEPPEFSLSDLPDTLLISSQISITGELEESGDYSVELLIFNEDNLVEVRTLELEEENEFSFSINLSPDDYVAGEYRLVVIVTNTNSGAINYTERLVSIVE